MEDDLVIRKLWRVKKTVMQLCHDRGYWVTQCELDETLDEFKNLYKAKPGSSSDKPLRAKLTMVFTHSTSNERLYVYFPTETIIRKSHIVTYCQKMQEDDVLRAIFVVQEALTPIAKRAVADFAPKFILEVFWESELLVNIMDHELVPKHIVLSNEQKEELFKKYHLSENLLMRLQSHDPVARYFGLRRGQVVKIMRNSETAGRYISYRLVC